MNIEAMVISAGQPQLERCLRSVKNQTVPFSNIVHIESVVPESKAFDMGVRATSGGWVMAIAGDFILYDNAVEIACKYMGEGDDKVFVYGFGLYDSFIKENICGCGVIKASIFQGIESADRLAGDVWTGRWVQKMGYTKRQPWKKGIVIGTHCDSPDEFQVFQRFYSHGVKHGKRYMPRILEARYDETKDPLYELAMRALWFGIEKRHYPTSHNLDFDREMYKEFLTA